MAATGQTWSQVGREWTLPRLKAWMATPMGKLPPLQIMIARYLGYEIPETANASKTRETREQAGERLLDMVTGIGRR